jgi:CPA2 family monovalent cation:H+ antiporter-2
MVADTTFYRDLAYVFGAAVIGGAIARKLRQPLILGYVLGGILISPFTPGPQVADVHRLELFAEIGVILLMFSIGIEFHIKDLLKVKWVAVIGGAIGILGSMGMGVAVGQFMGWSTLKGLVIGAIISVASTMVLARFLIDRGELRSERGRVMIAITLFEDLAVVIMTVVLPGLAAAETGLLPAVGVPLLKTILLLIPLGIIAAKLVPPLLRRLMRVHSQELFLVILLALCLGTAALTQAIGLSLALGAFVGGLVMSGSDYAREALGNLLPIRDAFVALFFVTVGLLIDPRSLIANVPLLLVLIAMIVAGKALIWTIVVRLFGYPLWTAFGVALGLTQIGEFSFILVQVARGSGLVSDDVYNAILAASLVSILLNALVWRFGMPVVDRMQAGSQKIERGESLAAEGHTVICGFGRVGGSSGAALDAFRARYTIIEIDPEKVKVARQMGRNCMFGDPSLPAVLQAAHAEKARLVLVTIPQADRAYLAIRNIRAINPHVPILARAHKRSDFELLIQAGATKVVQPETEAAATMIAEALEVLRIPDAQVTTYVAQFRAAMELVTPRVLAGLHALPGFLEIPVEQIDAVGKKLKDSGIRERFGVTVVRVVRKNGEQVFNPGPETILEAGDRLQSLGLAEDLLKFQPGKPPADL